MDVKTASAAKPGQKPSPGTETAEPKPKPRARWDAVIAGLMIGLAGLALTRLGYLWPNFDVLSAFSIHCLFLILASCLAALVPRWKGLAVIAISILCAVLYGAWPLAGFTREPLVLKPGEVALRIAHYNTRARNKDIAAIEKEIRALDADVIVLLEVSKDKMALYDHLRTIYPNLHTCSGIGKCETGIMSRIPFAAVSPFVKEDVSPPNLWVRLGAQQQSVNIIAVHLQRIPNLAKQNQHFRDLAKLLETFAGPIILTGDFNTTPYSRAIHDLELASGLQHQTYLPTWPAHFVLPQFAIDHIFLSPGIRPLAPPRAGEAGGSDHLPLVMPVGLSPG